jgi:hypothetical protein
VATNPTLYPFTNDRGDTFDAVSPDELRTGQTIELDGHRYAVDHVDLTTDPKTDAVVFADVHTTLGVVLGMEASDKITVVTRRGIPAPGVEPDRRAAGTVVRYWSGMKLANPATLVRLSDLRPGDVVQSSHGYRLHITSATVSGSTSALRGTLHTPDGPERTERNDAHLLIPVYERGPEQAPAPVEPITTA